MFECDICKKASGAVRIGPGTNLEDHIFFCYGCKNIVDGNSKPIDKNFIDAFFKIDEIIKKLDIKKEDEVFVISNIQDLFQTIWRKKLFKEFPSNILGGIILTALHYEEIDHISKSKIAKLVGTAIEDIEKIKEQIIKLLNKTKKA